MPSAVAPQKHPIAGVLSVELTSHSDGRGSFTELHREAWFNEARPMQWNLVRSHAGCLRGIHVHVRHADYLVVTQGTMRLCLGDLREKSDSFGRWEIIDLHAEPLQLVYVPPGVAHGFYFPAASQHLYGMSEYWCPEEEMGCHWADPALALPWQVVGSPVLSTRDSQLGPLDQLLEQMAPYQPLLA